jgi:2-polyprenyl-3-methyl-5-hydroxy-6-metoxy-1,4-benzoquinol methylase
MISLRAAVNRIGHAYVDWVCKREFDHQTFIRLNERPMEYGFVLRQMARLQPRTVLDVGTGTTALPHLLRNCGALVTAIDNVRDYWPAGMTNRHWRVLDDDIRDPKLGRDGQRFDLVTCISVLEHIPQHEAAVAGMLRLVAPGGHLILTSPFNRRQYSANVYTLPGSEVEGKPLPPYSTQSFSQKELDAWLALGARLVEQEFWQFYEGDQWTVGARLKQPRQVGPDDRHQIACTLLARS